MLITDTREGVGRYLVAWRMTADWRYAPFAWTLTM